MKETSDQISVYLLKWTRGAEWATFGIPPSKLQSSELDFRVLKTPERKGPFSSQKNSASYKDFPILQDGILVYSRNRQADQRAYSGLYWEEHLSHNISFLKEGSYSFYF